MTFTEIEQHDPFPLILSDSIEMRMRYWRESCNFLFLTYATASLCDASNAQKDAREIFIPFGIWNFSTHVASSKARFAMSESFAILAREFSRKSVFFFFKYYTFLNITTHGFDF